MKNPYQDTIDWLNSKEGIRWSWQNFLNSDGIWSSTFYTIKDDEKDCVACLFGYDHNVEVDEYDKIDVSTTTYRYREVAADLNIDGPYTEISECYVRTGMYRWPFVSDILTPS